MRKNPRISAEKLADLIGINIRNVQKNIDKLKSKNLVKRIGADHGGHWEVINTKQ